jgi:multiple sugar transport system ATP-binding protein
MARIDLIEVCKTYRGEVAGEFRGGGRRGAKAFPFSMIRGLADALPGSPSGFRIEDLDLVVPDGTVLAVLGPSGCGKSTLLRLIAGLLPLDGGRVLYDGVDVRDVPPSERRIGMVFQSYALYPNYDARTNVLSHYLFRKRTPELDAEAREKYRRTAELMGVELEKLMDRMPQGLSGGERQRVAVGRCITRDPRLFLLDEPFSNLDPKLRERYRAQLRILLKQFHVTTVYVTHDQVEALILADLIAIMNDGRIEQVGTAQQIYDEPRSVFAADFMNLEPETPSINLIDGGRVSSELSPYLVGARPAHVSVGGSGALVLRGELVDTRPLPLRRQSVLCVRAAGCDVYLRVDDTPAGAGGTGHRPGEIVDIALARCHLFDKASGLRVKSLG